MLQNNPQLAQIRQAITNKVISEFESLAAKNTDKNTDKDADTFGKIWSAFGAVIKEGIYEDFARREQLLKLARFTSTEGENRSLTDYVAALKPNQTEIYYLVGDSLDRLRSNPKLEAAKARGIEVLLLTDPVDAFWTSMPIDYEGKPLKSLSQGDVDFSLVPPLDQDASNAPSNEDAADTLEAVKQALGDKVSDVRASQRLTDSAACLVSGGFGPDRTLERMLAQQNRGALSKPVLELNLTHPLLRALANANADSRAEDVADIAGLLLDQAYILDGEVPDDPAAFAARLNRLVARGATMAAPPPA